LVWEDFAAGGVTELGSLSISRDDIVAFAAEFDPQPMHLDDAAAAASMLGGLAASGWHSCCLVVRMLADGLLGQASVIDLAGVEDVRWRAPVRAGEIMTARATVLETWPAPDRADRGFVKLRVELLDARAVRLMTMTMSALLGRVRFQPAPSSNPAQ
jgi:acyl dehydratase